MGVSNLEELKERLIGTGCVSFGEVSIREMSLHQKNVYHIFGAFTFLCLSLSLFEEKDFFPSWDVFERNPRG